MDMQILYHNGMLADESRCNLFKEVIKRKVNNDTILVDIGTGTGLLSSFALENGAKEVYSIEYFKDASEFSEKFLNQKWNNVKCINKSSYEVCISDVKPNILVTETIGLLGPEENIVELTYDFYKRHKSISSIIPKKLKLYYQFLHSERIEIYLNSLISNFLKYDYLKESTEDLKNLFSNKIRTSIINDCINSKISTPFLIKEYTFGIDQDSSFSTNIKLIPDSDCKYNLIHFYFDAYLDDETILSSNCFSNTTHWCHSYVYIPNSKKNKILNISYKSKEKKVNIKWF